MSTDVAPTLSIATPPIVPVFGSSTSDEARTKRAGFMRAHARTVYAELTDQFTATPRIDELLASAAERFPGLVPSAEEMAAEQSLPQKEKAGREIDQGIFLHHVLADEVAGTHLAESMLAPTKRALDLLDEFRATGELDLGVVRIQRDGAAAHLTIQNTDCLNAETVRHVEDMETAVDLALLDPAVRVCVLRGGVMSHPKYAGRRVFSAGINLRELHAGRIPYLGFLIRREIGYLSKIYRGLRVTGDWRTNVLEKPWIAAVDTFAIGGGMQLVVLFDHVIAEHGAFVSLPAAQEGIVPGAGNLRLNRLIGGRAARQVILSGRTLYVDEPVAAGVIDEVVDRARMDQTIADAVARLDAPAVTPNRHMLYTAEEPMSMFREYMAEFAMQQALRLYDEDVLTKVDLGWRAKDVS
jgi:thioesterase DpgC